MSERGIMCDVEPYKKRIGGLETYMLYEPFGWIGFDSLVSWALFHPGHDVGVASLVGFVCCTKDRALSEASESGFLRNNPDKRNELYLLHHPAEWITLTWWGGLLHQ
jgi:hypothetical protein